MNVKLLINCITFLIWLLLVKYTFIFIFIFFLAFCPQTKLNSYIYSQVMVPVKVCCNYVHNILFACYIHLKRLAKYKISSNKRLTTVYMVDIRFGLPMFNFFVELSWFFFTSKPCNLH